MTNLLASVAPGAIMTKNAPAKITKEAPVKRGGIVELKLNFAAASAEEVKKALGAEAPDGYIAGWASTTSRDLYNHEIVTGAFQEAIDKRGLDGPMGVKFLLDHDHTTPAGVIKVLEYRRGNLWMEAQMNLEVGYIRDRWQILKMMGGANFSVGFMLQDYEIVIRDEEDDYFLRIDKGDLFEISSVLLPGNEECQNVFVKSILHEDNHDEDELFFAKAKTATWRLGVSKNLPLVAQTEWDAAAARARVFKAAGFDTQSPDYEIARKAFVISDAANPQLKSSYKMLIADVIEGKLQVTEGAVCAALTRLPHTDLSDTMKVSAKAILESYQDLSAEALVASKTAPANLAEFERALVARGLAKTRNEAQRITQVVKACPQLFVKQESETILPVAPALDAGKLTEMLSLVSKMKAIVAPAAD